MLPRQFFIIAAIAVSLGVLFAWVPLLGDLHIETAQFAAVLFSLLSLNISLRKEIDDRIAVAQLFALQGLLIIPLLISVWISGCLSFDGILFYLTIPTVSTLLMYAVGRFLRNLGVRFPLLIGLLIWSVLVGVFPLLSLRYLPHLFVYNSIWGWFPGPVYDEQVVFPYALLLHRYTVLCWAAILWLLPYFRKQWLWFGLVFVSLMLSLLNWTSAGIVRPLERTVLELGGVVESKHFRMVYDPEGMSEQEARRWLSWHEFHLRDLATQLGIEPPTSRITSVVYRNPWQKQVFTGAKYTSYVPVWNKFPQLHLDQQSGEQLLRHELVHVLLKPFGIPILGADLRMGLTEGVAVAYDDSRYRLSSVDQIVVGSGREISASELEKRMSFTGFYTGRGGTNYAISGSFVRYLIETYGIELFLKLYGGKSIDRVYDIPIERLHEGWMSYLSGIEVDSMDQQTATRIFAAQSILERDCPRRVSELQRYGDATAHAFAEADSQRVDRMLHIGYERGGLKFWRSWVVGQLRLGNATRVLGDSNTRNLVDRDTLDSESVIDWLLIGDALLLSDPTLAYLAGNANAFQSLRVSNADTTLAGNAYAFQLMRVSNADTTLAGNANHVKPDNERLFHTVVLKLRTYLADPIESAGIVSTMLLNRGIHEESFDFGMWQRFSKVIYRSGDLVSIDSLSESQLNRFLSGYLQSIDTFVLMELDWLSYLQHDAPYRLNRRYAELTTFLALDGAGSASEISLKSRLTTSDSSLGIPSDVSFVSESCDTAAALFPLRTTTGTQRLAEFDGRALTLRYLCFLHEL